MTARETTTKQQQPRDRDGRYSETFEKLCRCGHTKGQHSAERVVLDGETFQECFAHDFDPDLAEPCECTVYRRAR